MRNGLTSLASIVALGGALFLCSSTADADVQHTIGKGHTIQAIANRYRVTPKSIIEANRLTERDVKRLKIGDVLTIPKVDPPKDAKGKDKDKDGKAKPGAKPAPKPTTYAAKAKTPGVIHVKRAASTEEVDLRIKDKGGKIAPTTLRSMEKIMRAAGGASHPIEARLISLLGIVSNHFGSRKIEVVSGFRPYAPTQYTQHSNHNHGKAIDFRVVGVPNEIVRDFCRTLKNVGCGYYPNSTFVHMDVRETSAFWIDFSKPGEPPRYNAANVDADEGTSDVHGGDVLPSANTAPVEPAPEPPPGSETTSDDETLPAAKPAGEE
ncbi:MAG: DUF882 domain-containing protein [Labilithrix sp.]|nr:DUF882 domain-containing protein [Labilithrix sp.]